MLKTVREKIEHVRRTALLAGFEAMRLFGRLSPLKKARNGRNLIHNERILNEMAVEPGQAAVKRGQNTGGCAAVTTEHSSNADGNADGQADGQAVLRNVLRNGFLENQNSLGALRYGVKSLSYCGCHVLAVYNALTALRRETDLSLLPKLISRFEQDGAAFSARFGTSPRSVPAYFRELGIRVQVARNPEGFRSLAASSDIMIFTFCNNRKKLSRQIHTICIIREKGGYTAHNSHGRREFYPDFDSLLYGIGDGGGLADGIYMAGFNKTSQK